TECICRPEDFAPSRDDFEVVGAFNPGVVEHDGAVILLVRVAERPLGSDDDRIALPRWEAGRISVDHVPREEWELLDPRVVRHRRTGLVRLTFTSHLRVVRCDASGWRVAEQGGRFEPVGEFESFGVEDPRIVCVDGVYWITYVAVSSHGPATALASTRDFETFERHGVIFPIENKDVVVFPERLDGAFAALHRPLGGTPFTRPEMWVSRSPDLLHWGRHAVVSAGPGVELDRIGAGAPPLRVAGGWLEIYHAAAAPESPKQVGRYHAAAMLLDARRPEHVIARSAAPLFAPEAAFERDGFVPDVVFPTGVIDRGRRWRVYYGAADAFVGCVELSRDDVLSSLSES
ncbi:MAG: glycosylase, partial [Planctomycetota bacterium]